MLNRRSTPLPAADAVSRTAAYVYGNVVMLAVLVPLTDDDLRNGTSVFIVLGTAASTFLAHLFANAVAASSREEQSSAWESLRHHTRDAVPILTSGFVPAALLTLAWSGVVGGTSVILAAEALLVLRIASTGMVAARLRGRPSSLRLILIGVGLSVLAAVVVAVKVVLTH